MASVNLDAGDVESGPADDLVVEPGAAAAQFRVDRKQDFGPESIPQCVAYVRGVEARSRVRVIPPEIHDGVQASLDPVAEGRRARPSVRTVDIEDPECARPNLVEVEVRLFLPARTVRAGKLRVAVVHTDRRRPPCAYRNSGPRNGPGAHLHGAESEGLREEARGAALRLDGDRVAVDEATGDGDVGAGDSAVVPICVIEGRR